MINYLRASVCICNNELTNSYLLVKFFWHHLLNRYDKYMPHVHTMNKSTTTNLLNNDFGDNKDF